MSGPSHCRFCGHEIIFRMMQGRCVPMHPKGGCPGHSELRDDDEKQPDCLYATSCPKCEKPVYFLRHNGGSTWLDDIPYPWPKHECFLDQSDPVPAAWREQTAAPGQSIIVRLYDHGTTVRLTPVDRKLRKWFKDLGTFTVILEGGFRGGSIHCQLALVSVASPLASRRGEFRAVTLEGQRMRLVPSAE